MTTTATGSQLERQYHQLSDGEVAHSLNTNSEKLICLLPALPMIPLAILVNWIDRPE